MKKIIVFFLLLISLTSIAKTGKSFAVIIDLKSYENCKQQVINYANSVKGFDSFIAAQDWKTPEQVRDSIRNWYVTKHLAGVVFVGDIPIAMIRKAQHLTSAFKMDEIMFPKRDSSIPSDRFYDDFGLKFDFVGRDSLETNFFYYNLDAKSAQEVSPDIFSGRIKPSSHYQDKYQELSKYLEKVVRIKAQTNKLDRVASYTGEGSFSNSMIAWKDETVTLQEQLPDAFKDIDGAQFFVFYQFPFMKDVMMKESKKADLDLLLFHHHGTPDRQWIGEYPGGSIDDEYYAIAKMQARNAVRTNVRYGSSHKEAMQKVMERYGLDSTWVCDTFDPKVSKADSLEDLRTGIELDDIHKANPNVRMLIFDACYNGDFRESDFVANRYVMGDGESVVALGNTVNVLQDKASSTLLGMLSAGFTVGEWHQKSAILESSVIGDPTFAFTSSYSFDKPDITIKEAGYWTKYLKNNYPCDIQGLALQRLYDLNYKGLSAILLNTYETSPYYMLRLDCLRLLKHYNNGDYEKALVKALDDPYEYTRRKACYFLGLRGNDSTVSALVDEYFRDYNAKRISFNILNSAGFFKDSLFLKTFENKLEQSDFIYDKKRFKEEAQGYIGGSFSICNSAKESIDRVGNESSYRSAILSSMRNNPYPQYAKALVNLVENVKEPANIRLQVAEILGWYSYAWNREEIVKELEAYLASEPSTLPKELEDEITKTIGRLKVYLR